MKTGVFLIFLCPLAFIIFLSGCDSNQPIYAQPARETRFLPILTASAGEQIEYATIGSVVSDRRIDVASRLSGYICDILVQEGDRVRRGQILVRLDEADVKGAIRKGEAAVSAAKAGFRDAQTDYEKFRDLFKRGSVSDNEWRKIRLKYEAASEAVNQAQAGLDTAVAQRIYTEIKSPLDGIVVARIKRAGDLALPGETLLTLESGKDLLFETFVAESRITSMTEGNPAEIRIDGLANPVKGTISRVVPSGDPVTRSYQVKIAMAETSGLMPGMFGRAVFPIGKSKSPVVPRSAMVERGGLRGVFVVDNSNAAYFRWLRIGREWPDRVEVSAGLHVGERLVAKNDPTLRDGDKIADAEAEND
ncbi:MAG: efflux RND transporter periplasmic adaptor subunit [Proteobacteria bacterium]|nr:efflux RND transporter periplasmic adaptor subunit [Pseudomonadota bacterium]